MGAFSVLILYFFEIHVFAAFEFTILLFGADVYLYAGPGRLLLIIHLPLLLHQFPPDQNVKNKITKGRNENHQQNKNQKYIKEKFHSLTNHYLNHKYNVSKIHFFSQPAKRRRERMNGQTGRSTASVLRSNLKLHGTRDPRLCYGLHWDTL